MSAHVAGYVRPPLQDNHRRILAEIVRYQLAHDGATPSPTHLAGAVGMSPAGVKTAINGLIVRGLLDRLGRGAVAITAYGMAEIAALQDARFRQAFA